MKKKIAILLTTALVAISAQADIQSDIDEDFDTDALYYFNLPAGEFISATKSIVTDFSEAPLLKNLQVRRFSPLGLQSASDADKREILKAEAKKMAR